VRADEKLTAFMELESAIRANQLLKLTEPFMTSRGDLGAFFVRRTVH